MDEFGKYIIIIIALLNAIAGCVAGIILVDLTDNYIYFIVNFVTGGASGALFSLAFLLSGGDE